jgi:hypothetical protein
MNEQIRKLVENMSGPAPVIKSFETYCEFYDFLDLVAASGVTDIQGWELMTSDDGRITYFGTHYNDYDFVWTERKIFNDWVKMINKNYEIWLNE